MNKNSIQKYIIPAIIIVFALLGLYVSFILSIDTINVIRDAGKDLPCTVSSTINCLSVMKSSQAHILGFPNSFMGIMGYSMILMFGVILLMTKIKNKRFLVLLNLGTLSAFIFSYWLLYSSVSVIGIICPLCVISCLSATSIFFVTTYYSLKQNAFKFIKDIDWEKDGMKIRNIFLYLVLLWFILVIGYVYLQFGNQIISLLNIKLYLPS